MNKTAILLSSIAIAITAHAQIPNNGFENWTGANPTGWVINGNVTKSSDHYPASSGNFSIRLESHGPASDNFSYAFAVAERYAPCSPTFPITGHPSRLCGYFKCSPFNNDTMQVGLMLFHHGVWNAGADFTTTNTVSDWTSFNVPISPYTTADSATIVISAFYNDTNCGPPGGPYGNSVLYVDNLSFDSLLTGTSSAVKEFPAKSACRFGLKPNPASDIVMLNAYTPGNETWKVSMYTINGTLVKSETVRNNQKKIGIADLPNGIYSVIIAFKNSTETKLLTVQK